MLQVVFVYDITNQQSFQDLDDWYELVVKGCKDKEMPLMCLVGNKVDLVHMQAVKHEQHNKFATSRKIKSFFCSAKSGDQVQSVFYQISGDLAGIQISKQTLDVIA
jgi:Ras-related protein Rab-28